MDTACHDGIKALFRNNEWIMTGSAGDVQMKITFTELNFCFRQLQLFMMRSVTSYNGI